MSGILAKNRNLNEFWECKRLGSCEFEELREFSELREFWEL